MDAIETEKIQAQTLTLVERAKAVKILTHEDYAAAGEFLIILKKSIKEVEETFKEPKSLAAATHKSICAAETRHLGPRKEAVSLVGRVMSDYLILEERRKREEEAKAKKIADAQAEEAKKALEEERLNTAATLDAMGHKEEAMSILEEPIIAPPVAAPVPTFAAPPVAAGVSARKKYRAVITDPNAIPRQYLIPNDKQIQKVVDAMGLQANIPGVSVREEMIMSGRTG